jgi:hypothetical protein
MTHVTTAHLQDPSVRERRNGSLLLAWRSSLRLRYRFQPWLLGRNQLRASKQFLARSSTHSPEFRR